MEAPSDDADHERPQGEVFDEIMRLRGFKALPPFYEVLQPYPRLTAQFWESLKAAMHGGSIDQKTKEMIAVAVCIALGCRYCTDGHIAMAEELGMTKAELEEIIMIVSVFTQTSVICSALDPKFVREP